MIQNDEPMSRAELIETASRMQAALLLLINTKDIFGLFGRGVTANDLVALQNLLGAVSEKGAQNDLAALWQGCAPLFEFWQEKEPAKVEAVVTFCREQLEQEDEPLKHLQNAIDPAAVH